MKFSTCAIGASQVMAAVVWATSSGKLTWKVDVRDMAFEAEDPEGPQSRHTAEPTPNPNRPEDVQVGRRKGVVVATNPQENSGPHTAGEHSRRGPDREHLLPRCNGQPEFAERSTPCHPTSLGVDARPWWRDGRAGGELPLSITPAIDSERRELAPVLRGTLWPPGLVRRSYRQRWVARRRRGRPGNTRATPALVHS